MSSEGLIYADEVCFEGDQTPGKPVTLIGRYNLDGTSLIRRDQFPGQVSISDRVLRYLTLYFLGHWISDIGRSTFTHD